MSIVRASAPEQQGYPERNMPYRSQEEIAIRQGVEDWLRAKHKSARVVHELVVGRGDARADVAAIGTDHFVATEIKSSYDSTSRLMQQACLFRLVAPELWIVAAEKHVEDTDLVRYLMPSVGVARAKYKLVPRDPKKMWSEKDATNVEIEVLHPAKPFKPHPSSMLQLLWVNELWNEASRHRLVMTPSSRPGTHGFLVNKMLKLDPHEQMASVCRQLRARQAQWRADPPISY